MLVAPPLELEQPENVVSSMGESLLGKHRFTLADIEQLALENNPTVLAAEAATGISSGLQRQVGMFPNPVMGYFGQQLADRGTDQQGLFFEQEFVRGHKLALNRQVLAQTNRGSKSRSKRSGIESSRCSRAVF